MYQWIDWIFKKNGLTATFLFANSLGPEFWSRSGPKLFEILIVYLKAFFEKFDYGRQQQKHEKLNSIQNVSLAFFTFLLDRAFQ